MISYYYNTEHRVLFKMGSNTEWYDSWFDWLLIPSKVPTIEPPKIRTKYVEIPGRDGQLDITEILTGRALQENIEGTWSFYVTDNLCYPLIVEALHGKKGQVYLSDDPDYCYEGRFEVGALDKSKDNNSVNIKYTLSPTKQTRS